MLSVTGFESWSNYRYNTASCSNDLEGPISGPLLLIAQVHLAFIPHFLFILRHLWAFSFVSAASREAPKHFEARFSPDPVIFSSRPPAFTFEKEIPVSRCCSLIKPRGSAGFLRLLAKSLAAPAISSFVVRGDLTAPSKTWCCVSFPLMYQQPWRVRRDVIPQQTDRALVLLWGCDKGC